MGFGRHPDPSDDPLATDDEVEALTPDDEDGLVEVGPDDVKMMRQRNALIREVEDYELLRARYAQAKDVAERTNEPRAKYQAAAAASYLRDRMVSRTPKQEDLEEFLETQRLAGHMPGKKVGFMAGADVADFGTSPVARPAYSALSASADIGYLNTMTSKDRKDWINNLHPDDPRADLFWELHEKIDAVDEEVGLADLSEELKKSFWSANLTGRYWLPGVDPYGGGPARPWQEIKRGGEIVGGAPATTVDVLVRGIIRGKAGDIAAPAARAKIHGAAEYLERPFETAAAAFDSKETMKEAWDRSGEEAYKVWSGHPDADPYEGSFLPSLVFTIAPDFMVPISGLFKGVRAIESAAGAVTKAGDNAVRVTTARMNDKIINAARMTDEDLTKEGMEALMDATQARVEAVYLAVGIAAEKGQRVGVRAHPTERGALGSALGERVVGEGASKMLKPTKRTGVVHVDMDEALTLGRADDGALTVAYDQSKLRVLYSDDPLVRAATKDALMRGMSAADKATLNRAMEALGTDKVRSSSNIYAELTKKNLAPKIALVGALGFGAGFLGAGEDVELGERFTSGLRVGMAGLAGGAAVLGGGRGVGAVVDGAGRKVASIGFKPGAIRANEIINVPTMRAGEDVIEESAAPFAERAEKFRRAMPGFKRFKPWAKRKIDKHGKEFWEPIVVADLVSDQHWASVQFLTRRKGITEAKLAADAQRAVFNVMKGVYRKEEREIVTALVESLGVGSKEALLADSLLEGLRKHLNKAIKFLPEDRAVFTAETGAWNLDATLKSLNTKGKKSEQFFETAEEQLKKLLKEDPYLEAGEITTADLILKYAEKAAVINGILRQTLGFATKSELTALRATQKGLDKFLAKTRGVLDDKEFVEAVNKMSPLEAGRAAKAFRKSGGKLDPRYADLSDAGKKAVNGAREFFGSMYRILKAQGGLPKDWSLDKFLYEMEVGGYAHHLLTKGGAKAIANLQKEFPRALSGIDTTLDVVKKRKRIGSAEEINEGVRRDLAEMIYREQNRLGADDVVDQSLLDDVIKANGLDTVKFFETDASKIMTAYSQKVTRWQSNFKYLENLRMMFPDGDSFAGMGRLAGDAHAARAGYRRVDGVTHLRAIAGEKPWDGFKDHADELQTFLSSSTESRRGEAIYEWLRERGIDIGDPQVRVGVEAMSKDMYLPHIYADMVETIAVPTRMEKWASGDGVLAKAIGTWDDVTNMFKVQTTILAPAFHGRNFISNVVTNTMVHGWKAVSPSNQIDSLFLMRAPDYAEYTLEAVTAGGQKYSIKKTVGEWREEMKESGIIVDNFDISDSIRMGGKPNHLRTGLIADVGEVVAGRGKFMTAILGKGKASELLRPSKYRVPAYTAALGASIGATAGYATTDKDKPEERLRRAFAGVLVGGMAGMGTGGMYDIFLRDPAMAARQVAALSAGKAPDSLKGLLIARPEFWQNMKPALSAGFDEWLDVVGGTGKAGFKDTTLHLMGGTSAGRVGLVGAGVGGVLGGATATAEENVAWQALKGAGAGLLGTGGIHAWGEGAFVIAGGMGRKIEEQAKIASYLAGRKTGLSAGASADIVHKTLFNYNDLSKFERHVLRRIFPFYTWSSKNATELQPWLLQNRPLSYSYLAKFLDAADGGFSSEHDMALLPDHMKYRAVVNAGLGKIVAGFGLPQEDLAELFKTRESDMFGGAKVIPSGLIGRLHPAVQLLYKFAFAKDPYYNVDLDRVRSARDVRYLPPFMREYVGFAEIEKSRMVGGKREKYTSYEVGHFPTAAMTPGQSGMIGAKRLALLRSFPAWRLVSEYNKVMADTFMGGVRAESGAKAGFGERFLAVTTGIKPYAVDWDRLEEYAYRDFESRLFEELKSRGEANEIPILYKFPKNRVDELEILRDLGIYEE